MPRANKTFSTSSMTNVPQNTASYGKHLPSQSRPAVSALDKPLSFYIPQKQSHNQSRSRYSPTPNPKTYTSKRNPPARIPSPIPYTSKRNPQAQFSAPKITKIPIEEFQNFENVYNSDNCIDNVYSKYLKRQNAALPRKGYVFATALPLVFVDRELCVLMNLEKRSDKGQTFLHFPAGGFDATKDANLYQTCIRELKEETQIFNPPLFELYHEVWCDAPHSEMVFYITPFEEDFTSYGFDKIKYKNGDSSTNLIEAFGNRLVKLKDVIHAMENKRRDIRTIATPQVDSQTYRLKDFHINEPDVIVSSLKEVLKAFVY